MLTIAGGIVLAVLLLALLPALASVAVIVFAIWFLAGHAGAVATWCVIGGAVVLLAIQWDKHQRYRRATTTTND